MELPKSYESQEYENNIYKKWEKSGLFNPDICVEKDFTKENSNYFSMVLPPPNRTGTLHMGHAVMLAIEDIMIRYNRMKGKKTWWIPGTDHAAIATQTKVEKLLLEKTGKTRHDFGREKFLEKVRDFAEESHDVIINQTKKMGASLDWDSEAYTLDEVRSRVVRMVFKKMYDDGLIYRGNRIVNWCPRCHSTLADDEVEYKETKAKLYTFKYDKDFPISIATTRPETKLGDTAVAVNSKDKRYKKFIGKTFKVNFCGQELNIKIISDKEVDMEYGTGALGVTPAHSQVDFAMAKEHNLEIKKIIEESGRMINVGEFSNLTAEEARKKVVECLEKNNLLEKTEEIDQNISLCYRCGAVIEPLTSEQWFIDVNKKIKISGNKYFAKGASLKEVSLKVVKNKEIKIIPERFEKTYFHWMENLRDWCISRQIWFGHRIPVYYDILDSDNGEGLAYFNLEEGKNLYLKNGSKAGQLCFKNIKADLIDKEEGYSWKEIKKAIIKLDINECKKSRILYNSEEAKESEIQDIDTLDTWFSSGLWTFSTMLEKEGFEKYKTLEEWIKNSPKIKEYHPTSMLETGYDILFFWIARMILMTTYVMGEIPFKEVYLHGLVRDEQGRKMSKSLGNTINPLDMIKKYGADATRLSLVIGATPGNDMKLSEEKVAGFRNFTNKLWNISRYILMSVEDVNIDTKNLKPKTLADKWILSRFNKLKEGYANDLEKYNFSQAGEKLRDFTWNEFADWYVEISKIEKGHPSTGSRSSKDQILLSILKDLLKMWHPFMPFVTEQIWQEMGMGKILLVESWPEVEKDLIDKEAEDSFELIKDIVVSLRYIRSEFKIPYSTKFGVVVSSEKYESVIKNSIEIINKLSGLSKLIFEKKYGGKFAIGVGNKAMLFPQIKDLVDVDKEMDRIIKEVQELEKYIKGVDAKLSNKEFVKKAPEQIVSQEKEKLEAAKGKLEKLNKQLESLK